VGLCKPVPCAAEPRSLAFDLFTEGEWAACRTECSRLLGQDHGDDSVGLIKAMAEQRLGMDSTDALRHLSGSATSPPETAHHAQYELGRALWSAGQGRAAFGHLRSVFENATTPEVFLRAGCSLAALLDELPQLSKTPALALELAACMPLWSERIQSECAPPPTGATNSCLAEPPLWLIGFYRRQIAPAIGQRCSLSPSCSSYAVEALRKHGLLGLAIYADRSIREPNVVSGRQAPVTVNGRRRYRDPLVDHDWWMGTEDRVSPARDRGHSFQTD